MDSPTFIIIPFGSETYLQSVALREEILRKPLGLRFKPEDLEVEKDFIHVCGYLDNALCATAMLVPLADRFKMQRVAVSKHLQGQGIGSRLLAFCEDYARQQGISTTFCHARETAIPFYRKHGY